MAVPEDEANKDPSAESPEEHTEIIEVEEEEEKEEIGASEEEVAEELSPEEALAAALEEVARFKDVALRAEAEMQNMQRRTARDIENAHKFGIERFLQNLLPVIDSIEKAVEAAEEAGGGDDPIAEGIRLCHKLLLDVVIKENIEVVDPLGEPFDPNLHQAMSMVDNPDMEPNSVFAVVQKGYTLNGRLVRPAMVMVTKAPEASETAEADAAKDE